MGQILQMIAEDGDSDEFFMQQQQRMSLRFLQHQMRSAQGRPEPRPPGWFQAPVVKTSVHLHGRTLDFKLGEAKGAQTACVKFVVDTSLDGQAFLHRRALVVPDGTSGLRVKHSEWSSPAITFKSGLDQQVEMAVATGVLDFGPADADAGAGGSALDSLEKFYTEEEAWELNTDTGDIDSSVFNYPWALELRAESEVLDSQWTFFRVGNFDCFSPKRSDRRSISNRDVQVISQQVVCDGLPVKELQEVYGSELGPQGARSECIICQSDACDTMLLPCRHLCMCSACADYVRTRSQSTSHKCPVCRKGISRIMYAFQPEGETVEVAA